MLNIAKNMRDLSFSKLMEVYREGNLENGRDLWPDLPEGQQLIRAEQDFYNYLTQVFFPSRGAVYAIWEEKGSYLCALRLEPYKDGLLLEALETHPEHRRKGYAQLLIYAVRERTGSTKIYSHVHKSNIPSLKVHQKCGFQRIQEYAVYVDGSFNNRCCTLCLEETIQQKIRAVEEYERHLFGAYRQQFNNHLDRWHSDLRPDQANNNFFVPKAELTCSDLEAAIAYQKSRGLNYLMIRTEQPIAREILETYLFEQEVIQIMALRQNSSAAWKHNREIVIRDIQTSDISKDILDVSSTPEKYRVIALRNMQLVLEVARQHPEYHWLCAYKDGKRVGSVYALCHNGCIEVDDLWVEEGHRNQYIATSMMKYIAENWQGILYLHANASASPRDMYAKMGFETVETTREYYLQFE